VRSDAVDHLKFTTIAHAGMAVCNPVGDEVLDDTLAVLAQRLPAFGALVLDVGCGKAEMLLRLAERYGVDGVGVDSNHAFLAEARGQAEQRLPHGAHDGAHDSAHDSAHDGAHDGAHDLTTPPGSRAARHAPARVRPTQALPGVDGDGPVGRLTLHGESFAEFLARRTPDSARFDAVLCIGASQAVGTPPQALVRLAQLLAPGGALLLGEGYWRCEPTPDYLAALGATADELCDHAGTRELGDEAGLTCVHAVETSFEDFESYERRYARAIEAWVAAHPEDPDAPAMAQRIGAWQAAFRQWGRDTLGFGLYLFIAP